MTDSPLRESKTWEPNSSERWSDSTPTLPSPLRRVNSQSMDGDASLDAHTLGQFGKLRFVVLTRQAVTWFKRSATDVLFGDERGTLPWARSRASPRATRTRGASSSATGRARRWFLCKAGDDTSEAWRGAIEAARRDAVEGAVDFRGPAPSPSHRAASPTVVSLVKSVAGGDANLISRRVQENEEIRVGEVKTDETLTLVCGDGDLDIDPAVLAEALDVGEAFVEALLGPAAKPVRVKRHYPHYWCGRGRRGELIYVERVGHVDAAGLKRDGVTIDHLVRHYILLHEFTWSVLAPAPDGPTSYQCVVLDVDGVQLSQCRGIRFDYVRRCAAIAKEHYPERCSRMVIANAPQWFSVVWKMVSPLVDPNTKKKIRITRPGLETLAALREVADDDQIPEIYGGKLRDAHASDLERQLLAKLGKA
ncbi:hypothetical protein JL722_3152 [Aureococcus anophagefferens]|nr:hypothetical protein JL722_3152 [Aureococcus anophagefferens]